MLPVWYMFGMIAAVIFNWLLINSGRSDNFFAVVFKLTIASFVLVAGGTISLFVVGAMTLSYWINKQS